ncbi:hypothetical protein VC87395_001748 [Vibrio paracholerae 87395]|nr:hypothetical protein VC87395_001748 [Vibrio paracholerae 87395]
MRSKQFAIYAHLSTDKPIQLVTSPLIRAFNVITQPNSESRLESLTVRFMMFKYFYQK